MSTGRDSIGTFEDLHALATKITGLSDFGEDDYTDGLRTLLDSCARDASLTPAGNKAFRAVIRGALAARLRAEDSWKQHPDYADAPVERPIFVTGLPRTGTTALHRLLTADPAHQGLEVWLAEMPQPRPPRDTWEDDPAYRAIHAAYQQHHVKHPEFMGVHYMSADMVEECWQLLRQSFRSVSFECLAHLPTYSAWLAEQDWTPAYRRYRRNLQLIGMNDPGKRWVLKNPSHLFSLDALLKVHPDALIIQTHRDPRTSMASMCSLAAHSSAGWSTAFEGPVIGRSQLDLWGRGLDLFRTERAEHDPSRFYDVAYEDFIRDPLATAEGIYAHFGLPLTDEARSAMAALHSGSTPGESRPSHAYSLEEFGLTPQEVEERFA